MPTVISGTTLNALTTVSWGVMSLFANNEQGVWFDPSDLTTMFQDNAGTTPVTAVEQPVGLLLDKSRGSVAQTGYYSGVFDGTGDYLSLANNAAFSFGSDAFTIEAWFYVTATASTRCIVSNYQNTSNGWSLQVNGTNLIFNGSGDGVDITGTTTIAVNTWYHVAVSGQVGSIKMFLNGVQEGSTYTGAVALNSTAITTVGALWAGVVANPFFGSISNVRLVKGTAVYTANFTPPTAPLTAISGTSLLTCQNSTFVDNSSNAFTITANGDAKKGANNPFGNHASQATSASRPVLSARVNALVQTEDFSNASWNLQSNISISSGVSDPDGGSTAFTITANSAVGRLLQYAPNLSYSGISSIWIRRRTGTGAINWEAPAVGVGQSISLTSSWQRVSYTTTPPGGGTWYYGFRIADSGDAIDIWHPDLRVANAGTNLPPYQRVGGAVTGTTNPTVTGVPDYDTAGFPLYLKFDGVDDSLSTNAFSISNPITSFAGVRFISGIGYVTDSVSGTRLYNLADGGTRQFGISAGLVTAAITVANITNVDTAAYNGASSFYRRNGALIQTGNTGSGTISTGLAIGRSQFNDAHLNGHLYSLIVRGALSNSVDITNTEAYINSKTKAY